MPFAALNSDPVVMEHFPEPLTRAESDVFVDRIEERFESQGFGLWALEVVDPERPVEFIGYTGLNPPSFEAHFTPAIEVGWRLARTAWGHGYASEAALAAVRHGFEVSGLDEIVSFTTIANVRSQAVMRRIGMTHDPSDDFDMPTLPVTHPMRRHVLYRLRADAVRETSAT